MLVLSSATALGYVGLAMVAIAVITLLIATFHPEARRRPGGYLDGRAPQPGDRTRPDERDESRER